MSFWGRFIGEITAGKLFWSVWFSVLSFVDLKVVGVIGAEMVS